MNTDSNKYSTLCRLKLKCIVCRSYMYIRYAGKINQTDINYSCE